MPRFSRKIAAKRIAIFTRQFSVMLDAGLPLVQCLDILGSQEESKTFAQIINLSVSETLSRTILTSGATMLSMLAFFIWGTGVLKDFAFAMVVVRRKSRRSRDYPAAPVAQEREEEWRQAVPDDDDSKNHGPALQLQFTDGFFH